MINPFREKIRSTDITSLLNAVLSEMADSNALDQATQRWVARVLALIKANRINVQSFIADRDVAVTAIANTIINLLNKKELTADQDRWYRSATVLASLWDASPDARVPSLARDYLVELELDDREPLDEVL